MDPNSADLDSSYTPAANERSLSLESSTTAENDFSPLSSSRGNPQIFAQGLSVWPDGASWIKYAQGFVDSAAAILALATSWAHPTQETHTENDESHASSPADAEKWENLRKQLCKPQYPEFLCCSYDTVGMLISNYVYDVLKHCGTYCHYLHLSFNLLIGLKTLRLRYESL